MAIGGSRLSPRLPPTPASTPRGAPAQNTLAAARPAAPVTTQATVNAPPPSKTKPAGQFQPTAAAPAAPVVSQTTVSPNPGSPSPLNPFVGPTKLSTSTSASASGVNVSQPSYKPPSPTVDYNNGLSATSTGQYGGKVTLGGAQMQANAHYQPTSNFQMGAQGSASGSVASGSASASNSYNAVSGVASGKLSASAAGPQVSATGTQTAQYGNSLSNKIEATGTASAGNASASVGGQLNTHNGLAGVNASATAMGPHASASLGHTTQVGPFTFSNSVTAAAGTAGAQAGAHAGMNNGVLSWGANAQVLAGVGGGFSHTASFDPSWFASKPPSAPAAPPPTAAQTALQSHLS